MSIRTRIEDGITRTRPALVLGVLCALTIGAGGAAYNPGMIWRRVSGEVLVNNGNNCVTHYASDGTTVVFTSCPTGNFQVSVPLSVGSPVSSMKLATIRPRTQNVDVPSIAANSCVITSVTATGVDTTNDGCIHISAGGATNVTHRCFVNGADSVGIQSCNPTTGAIDVGSTPHNFITIED